MPEHDDTRAAIGAGTFWRLMGMRPVGAAIVTASHADVPAGLLALSVTHVAASPPTMLVCVGRSTSALATIKAAGSFAISYLPAGAAEVAEVFGGRRGLTGADRFNVGRWTTLPQWEPAAPVLADSVLALGCRVCAVFSCGDTEIIAAQIECHASNDQAVPLVALRGSYQAMPLPPSV